MEPTALLMPVFGKPDVWVVAKKFKYQNITVPEGFYSDLDSVPRIPYIYSLLKGRCVYAAIVHDYLYGSHEVSRKEADRVFLEAMETEGVIIWRRYVIFATVALFGGKSYSEGGKNFHKKMAKGKDHLETNLAILKA